MSGRFHVAAYNKKNCREAALRLASAVDFQSSQTYTLVITARKINVLGLKNGSSEEEVTNTLFHKEQDLQQLKTQLSLLMV